MRAPLCVEPGRLETVGRPIASPGASEAPERVRRARVCGADFPIFEGSHTFVSVAPDAISFPDPKVGACEIARLGGGDARRAVFEALCAGRVPTQPFATLCAQLDESPQRFAEWIGPERGAVKALSEN